jgi:hypothetical protein
MLYLFMVVIIFSYIYDIFHTEIFNVSHNYLSVKLSLIKVPKNGTQKLGCQHTVRAWY